MRGRSVIYVHNGARDSAKTSLWWIGGGKMV